MDHFKSIYQSKAREYHRLIAAEDVDGNLLATLERIASIRDQRVLDLGTGTGRLPLLLHDRAAQIIGLDLYAAMLNEQAVQRHNLGGEWDLLQGDMHTLPLPDQWADIVTAGWAIGHFVSWHTDEWQNRVDQVVAEMKRVVKPGGTLIILETLGTGSLKPTPPDEGLAHYYAILEEKWDFERREIATDYQFGNVEEAIEKLEFFFGVELSEKIRSNNWSRLPEWTGVWSKHN